MFGFIRDLLLLSVFHLTKESLRFIALACHFAPKLFGHCVCAADYSDFEPLHAASVVLDMYTPSSEEEAFASELGATVILILL